MMEEVSNNEEILVLKQRLAEAEATNAFLRNANMNLRRYHTITTTTHQKLVNNNKKSCNINDNSVQQQQSLTKDTPLNCGASTKTITDSTCLPHDPTTHSSALSSSSTNIESKKENQFNDSNNNMDTPPSHLIQSYIDRATIAETRLQEVKTANATMKDEISNLKKDISILRNVDTCLITQLHSMTERAFIAEKENQLLRTFRLRTQLAHVQIHVQNHLNLTNWNVLEDLTGTDNNNNEIQLEKQKENLLYAFQQPFVVIKNLQDIWSFDMETLTEQQKNNIRQRWEEKVA